MKYYFIKESSPFNYEKFGTSKLNRISEVIRLDEKEFVECSEVKLRVRGEEGTKKLNFLIYYANDPITYLLKMIPEFHSIFSQFNMPEHRWYKAEAGYDLEFVKDMKKYFKIEYPDIDLKEKREYWILQFLFYDCIKELDYKSISFDILNFKTKEKIDFLPKGSIKNYEEYVAYTEAEYQKRKCVLIIKDYIYHKNYDILWGGPHIVFNEKVKAALDASNLINYDNGLEFAEFTEYEIVMLGEK